MVGRAATLRVLRVSDNIGAGCYGYRASRLDDGNDRLVLVGLPTTALHDPKNHGINRDETSQNTE